MSNPKNKKKQCVSQNLWVELNMILQSYAKGGRKLMDEIDLYTLIKLVLKKHSYCKECSMAKYFFKTNVKKQT